MVIDAPRVFRFSSGGAHHHQIPEERSNRYARVRVRATDWSVSTSLLACSKTSPNLTFTLTWRVRRVDSVASREDAAPDSGKMISTCHEGHRSLKKWTKITRRRSCWVNGYDAPKRCRLEFGNDPLEISIERSQRSALNRLVPLISAVIWPDKKAATAGAFQDTFLQNSFATSCLCWALLSLSQWVSSTSGGRPPSLLFHWLTLPSL
jgi:hypothetical protein